MEKSGFLMITLLIESSFRLKTGKHVSTYPTPASLGRPRTAASTLTLPGLQTSCLQTLRVLLSAT